MSWHLIAMGVFVVGCGARVSDGVLDDVVDASNGDDPLDGGDDTSNATDSAVQPTDATVAACGNARKVYLEFNGVTLTQAAPSNAAANQASWITNGTSVVPPWHNGNATRLADIATIVAGVKSRLAATPIDVVTTKPATGPFVMIVFGGQSTGNGGTVGTIYGGAVNEHDCGDIVKSDVGWISDLPSVVQAQNLAVGAIGFGLGLNGTANPNDCMCAWANNCQPAAGVCTLSASIATTTSLPPATTCPNQNPQNEVAAFTTNFCQ